ncbi:hypothetical protein TWF703_003933 [Orbilia oligospora]|uniref:Protein kinase domain-containing protein n=1 Tax=Orbilia oligospora TaxID=2813651 RepID=A0A7C8JVY0_ORBOL|nr:hypothetical protein TWF703_003933 [Orbilia oligospora]
MNRCQIKGLIQNPGSTHGQGFSIKETRTWQAYGPEQSPPKKQSGSEQFSFHRSELRNFPVSSLKGLILDSYLSSFVMLIGEGTPSYILYLLLNESKDVPNVSAKISLDRFRLEVLDANQKIQKSYEEGSCKIGYSIGGVNFMLSIDEEYARGSGTGILGREQYRALISSYPRYFMKDLFSQPTALHKFEEHDCLPILDDVKILGRDGNAGGEAEIYFADIEGHGDALPSVALQTGTLKSHLFAVKTFRGSGLAQAQGLREWFSVLKAIKTTPKTSLKNILAPLSAFLYRETFCIVYPRAICSLEKLLTCTNPNERPRIEISVEGLWFQLQKIATLMETFHSNGHLHLDLTLANLLVSEKGELILCDFGESGVPSSDLSTIEKLGIPNLEGLGQVRIGDILTRVLHKDPEIKRGNFTTEEFLRSYDLASFGRICFEVVVYKVLGWQRSNLYERLNDEDEPLKYKPRKGTLYRCDESERVLGLKGIVEELLKDVAALEGRVDYFKVSRVIGNLISPSTEVRLNQEPNLSCEMLQCLPGCPNSLDPIPGARETTPKEAPDSVPFGSVGPERTSLD